MRDGSDGDSGAGHTDSSTTVGPGTTAATPTSTATDTATPAATATSVPAFDPGPTDWPSCRFDAGNTGVHPSAPGPGTDLSVAWTRPYQDDDESGGAGPVSAAVVLDGTVFVACRAVVESTPHHLVTGFDLASGERQWQRQFRVGQTDVEGIVTPPRTLGSDGRRLFLMTPTDGLTLTALSPSTGDTLFERSLDAAIRAPVSADAGEVVTGDRLYSVFDAADGERQFRYRPSENSPWLTASPPTVTADTVYATTGNELHAVDRDRGERRWRASPEFPSVVFADAPAPINSPVVRDGVAYATTGRTHPGVDAGGMVALSTDDGSELWRTIPEGWAGGGSETPSNAIASLLGIPLVLEDTVYVYGLERGELTFFAIDASDGSVRWKSAGRGAEVAADGLLYSGGGRAAAVDPETGDVLGTATVDGWEGAGFGEPAVAGEFLVVPTGEGVAAFGPG